MADMQYDTGGLRDGGRGSRRSAREARTTEGILRGGTISAAAFGNVGNAGTIAGQTTRTRDERATGAGRAAEHRDDQAARATSAAGQGDGLTTGSTAIANAAPRPRPTP